MKKSPSAAFGKEKKGGKSPHSLVYLFHNGLFIHYFLIRCWILTCTASDAAGLEQTQEMKNVIDDLIHCCPPQAFHLALSLLCTAGFKPHEALDYITQGRLRDRATTWALSVSVSTGWRHSGCAGATATSLELREGTGCSCTRKSQNMNLTSFLFKQLLRAGLHSLWPIPQPISFILHFQIFLCSSV